MTDQNFTPNQLPGSQEQGSNQQQWQQPGQQPSSQQQWQQPGQQQQDWQQANYQQQWQQPGPQQQWQQPGYQQQSWQQPGYQAPAAAPGTFPKTETDRTLQLIAFVFMLISTISVCWALIPLAWMIPMTVMSWQIYKGTRPNTVAFGVCSLIFVSLIGGILLLVSQKDR